MSWQPNPYHMHPYQRADQDNQQQCLNDKESNPQQDLHQSNQTTGLDMHVQPNNTGMNERNGHGDSYSNGDHQQSQCLNLGMQKRDEDDQVKTQE